MNNLKDYILEKLVIDDELATEFINKKKFLELLKEEFDIDTKNKDNNIVEITYVRSRYTGYQLNCTIEVVLNKTDGEFILNEKNKIKLEVQHNSDYHYIVFIFPPDEIKFKYNYNCASKIFDFLKHACDEYGYSHKVHNRIDI